MSIIDLMIRNELSSISKGLVIEYVDYAVKCGCSGAEAFWIGAKKIKELRG